MVGDYTVPSDAMTHQQVDSMVDRAELRLMIEGLHGDVAGIRTGIDQHQSSDDEAHKEFRSSFNKLFKLRTQIYLVTALVILFGAGIMVGGRWAIRHAVFDAVAEAEQRRVLMLEFDRRRSLLTLPMPGAITPLRPGSEDDTPP